MQENMETTVAQEINVLPTNERQERHEFMFVVKNEDMVTPHIAESNTQLITPKEELLIPETSMQNETGNENNIFWNVDIKPKMTSDFGCQVRSGDLITYRFTDCIKTDADLSTLTGIQNFDILDGIVELVEIAKPWKMSEKLSIKEKIILMFLKLKHNLSYSAISVLFGCYSERHCRQVIIEMLNLVSACLKSAIPWPCKNEIQRNIPACFNDFPDVRVIVGCTEITVQKPTKSCCQLLHCSHHKGAYTIKYLTGVTPGGLISYVGKAHGGRASDKAIFEESGMITMLEKGDALMTDNGFLIDTICQENDIKLIRAPLKKNKKQLSARIGRARIHIERTKQRLKAFKILGDTMPSSLLSKCNEIFMVICGVTNLGSPIFSDDKFST